MGITRLASATRRQAAGAVLVLGLAGSPGTGWSAAREPTPEADAADVVDLQERWHFTRVEAFYRVDSRVLACVQTADGRDDLWDPRRDALLHSGAQGCVPPPGSRTLDPTVVSARIAGATGSIDSDARFGGARAISWHAPDFDHCPSAFGRVYSVSGPPGPDVDFFVLARLRHPQPVDREWLQACGLVAGVVTLRYTPRYDGVQRLQAIDLGDQRTLLVSSTDDGEPVVLRIRALPRSAWTGRQGISLVPASLLQPALDRAGPDFPARERAVVEVLRAAR